MNRIYSPTNISFRIWAATSMVFGIGWLVAMCFSGRPLLFWTALLAMPAAAIGSIPVFFIILVALPLIEKLKTSNRNKIINLAALCLGCTAMYGAVGGLIFYSGNIVSDVNNFLLSVLGIMGALFACALIAIIYHQKKVTGFFFINPNKKIFLTTKR